MNRLLLCFLLLQSAICNLHSAIVTGSLHDISVQGLNTKLMFSPTNEVLPTGSGLSAGPPKIVATDEVGIRFLERFDPELMSDQSNAVLQLSAS